MLKTMCKKVLFITTHCYPANGYGGPVQSMKTIVEYFKSEGVFMKVLTSSSCRSLGSLDDDVFSDALGVKVHSYRSWILKRWGLGLPSPRLLKVLNEKWDIVYVNGVNTFPTTFYALIALFLGKKVVVAPRGGLLNNFYKENRRNLLKLLFSEVFVHSIIRRSIIHCASKFELNDLLLFEKKAQCFVGENGIMRDEVNTGIDITESNTIVLAGRLSPEKGILEFVEKVNDYPGNSLHIKIVGSVDKDLEYFKQLKIAANSCKHKVEFLGQLKQDELFKLLRQSAVLALPSGLAKVPLRENYGNVVPEALSCGCSVIVSSGLCWDDYEFEGIYKFQNFDDSLFKQIEFALKRGSDFASRIESINYFKSNFDYRITGKKLMNYFKSF